MIGAIRGLLPVLLLMTYFAAVSSAAADPAQRLMGDIFNFVQHKIEKKRHKRELEGRHSPATYSVGGMRVGEIADLGPNYACHQIPSDASFMSCSASERRSADRGSFTQRTNVIMDGDGRVICVDRFLSPAFFAPGEMGGDIDGLSRTFGSAPRVRKRAVGNGHAVIATWGNISLDALGPFDARGREPASCLTADFMNNLGESGLRHLPVFRPAGGPGFVWIAYDNGDGVGRLRFFTTNPSLLPDFAAPVLPRADGTVSADAEQREAPQVHVSKPPEVQSPEPPQAEGAEPPHAVVQVQDPQSGPAAEPAIQPQGTSGETWHAPPAPDAPSSAQVSAPATRTYRAEDTRTDQLLTLLAWASVAGMIALTVAGATKRVVIFSDSVDLVVSFAPFVLPLMTLYLLRSIAPASCSTVGGQTHCSVDVWAAVTGDFVVMAVFLLAAIFYVACLFRIFAVSIAANGLPLGLAVGGFKIIASSLLGFVIALAGYGYFASKSSRDSMKAAVLVGLATWLLASLVNGPEVLARRRIATM